MANSLPFLSDLSLSVTLDEEAVNLAPQLIDADVTFFDADNNFDGGTLVLSGALSEDTLAIRNQGTGVGEIGLSGSDVTYEGTVIGTFTGGSGGVALSVTFNAQANSAGIEALVENLTYQNLSDTPVFSRALELTITDADGAHAVGPTVMQAVTGAANPFNGIDVGYFSAPAFADLDGDGDLDAVSGEFNGTLKYYENTGTGVAPAYVGRTGAANPFNDLDVGTYSRPAFADLDGDGDLDAVIGENYGTLKYFENTGTGVAPAYVERTGAVNPFNGIDVGFVSTPSFADLDGDGDLDAAIGERAGTLKYFENTGTGVAPAYVARTGAANPFDGIDVGSYSKPTIADLDGDGDFDAVSGEFNGTLQYFENTGTGVVPVYVERSGAANPFNGIDVGYRSVPSFADLDGDGDLDAVVGEYDGSLNYYENAAPGGFQFVLMVTQHADPSAGPDVMNGTDGADAIDGQGGNDTLIGGAGNDTLDGGADDDSLAGGAGNDALAGGTGNDTLDGGAGTDTLTGGAGNDTYVFIFGDVLVETAGQGTDTVLTAGPCILPTNLENITITGTLDGGVEGNAGNNVMTGNSGMNFLDGLEGDDTLDGGAGWDNLDGGAGNDILDGGGPGRDDLFGGQGNDTYIIDDPEDIVVENALGGGIDTVRTGFSGYILPGQVENLTLTGSGNINGSGNVLDNLIVGNSGNNALYGGDGNDFLDGGDGNDVLNGGAGADSFVLAADPIAANADHVVDFSGGGEGDKLLLDANYLTGPTKDGALNPLRFMSAPGPVSATTADQRILYDTDSGEVFYDADGVGVIAQERIFTLDGAPALAASDIVVFNGISYSFPVAIDDTLAAVEDIPVTYLAVDLLGNDTDLDLDTLLIQAVDGDAVLNGDGTVTFTPGANFNGQASFLYVVSDGTGFYDEAAVTVNVAPVNDAPVANDDTVSATEDVPLVFAAADLVDNDTDVEDDTLTVTAVSNAVNGTVSLVAGNITFTPGANFNGTASFDYTLSDGTDTDTGSVTVNVAAVNDAPTVANAIADQPPTQINNPFTFTFAANTFADAEGNSLTYTATQADDSALPTWLTFTPGTRSFSGTPLEGDIDVIDVKVTANDGNGGTFSEVFTITVVTDNDNLTGGAGNDVLNGGTGNDTLDGGAGNDTLIGGAGNDSLDGGSGTEDVVSFSSSTAGVIVNLALGNAQDGLDGTDTFVNIERVAGSEYADSILGGTGSDYIEGVGGDDTLDGLAGSDTLIGGGGNDTYRVDSQTDVIVENEGEGTDAVISTAGYYVLAANVENLTHDAGGNHWSVGNALANVLTGNDQFDTLEGGSGADSISGGGADDQLFGGADNDTLDGGGGVDTLVGGADDDLYVLNTYLDVVIEDPSGGTDTLLVEDSYTLPDYFEHLTLTGTGNFSGTGNALANHIIGNSGSNTLNGLGGVDTLAGGAGSDNYLVDVAADVIIEADGEGTDSAYVLGSTYVLGDYVENLYLWSNLPFQQATGNALDNYIVGGDYVDTLDGGVGADTMDGYTGDDTYYVDDPGDVIFDSSGFDTVISTISYTLTTATNYLRLAGTQNIDGTGNGFDNQLFGNSGDNVLDSGGGSGDWLQGGSGNDTYIVRTWDVTVIEDVDAGDDIVYASATFSLPDNVEDLVLTEAGISSDGTGNALGNAISGNSYVNHLDGGAGEDTLDGGAGEDFLTGGTGSDVFVAAGAKDYFTDFTTGAGGDQIDLGVLLAGATNYAGGDPFASGHIRLAYAVSDLQGIWIQYDLDGGGDAYLTAANVQGSLLITDLTADNFVGGFDPALSPNQAPTVYTAIEGTATEGDWVEMVSHGFYDPDGAGTESLQWQSSADGIVWSDLAGWTSSAFLPDDADVGRQIRLVTSYTDGRGTLETLYSNATSAVVNVNDVPTGEVSISGAAREDETLTAASTLADQDGLGTIALQWQSSPDGSIWTDISDAMTSNLTLDGSLEDLRIRVVASYTDGHGTAESVASAATGPVVNVTDYSSISWTLAPGVEKLVLTGTDDIDGTGNSLSNTITGNSGANVLDGLAGSDTLIGGGGNDTYRVDSQTDVIVENEGEGTDAVISTAGYYVLAANVENLTHDAGGNHWSVGNALANVLTGNDQFDTLEGGSGADSISGGGADDQLFGGADNDTLDGGGGVDTLVGGADDDLYVLNTYLDVVIEDPSGGTDTLLVEDSYTLPDYFEHLTLTGTGNFSGTGNALANHIIGNSGSNTLNGLGGVDTLAGGAGSDNYLVDVAADVIIEADGEGTDSAYVLGSTYVLGDYVENLYLWSNLPFQQATGNALDNYIVGGDYVDTLDGGVGADTMDGYTGDDTYYVDDPGDVIFDSSGFDTVISTISYTLTTATNYLRLAGTQNIDGTGNGFDNQLFGNSGDNVLDSGGGSGDWLQGGSGNDTYIVRTWDVTVIEDVDAGDDIVYASATFSLPDNVEDLVLTEAGISSDGTGNALGNAISGNSYVNHLDGGAGEDTLDGGAGEDFLTGGTGSDVFVAAGAKDYFTDFTTGAGGDQIDLGVLLAGATNYAGGDPFASGHIRLAYAVSDLQGIWIQYDLDGGGDAYLTAANVQGSLLITDLTADNFVGGFDPALSPNQAPTVYTAIEGTATEGDWVEMVSHGFYDPDGAGTESLQWQSSADGIVWSDLAGWTSSAFLPDDADVGRQIRLVTSYTDGRGTLETLYSNATSAVVNVNDAPVAGDDTVSATENTPLVFAAADLVANDTDVENDALTVTAVGNAVNGTVSLVGGNITFTPDADFTGTASFNYTVSDGTDTDSGAVTVNVAAAGNNPPVANDDTLSATEDTPLTFAAADLVGNDADADDDTLTVTAVGNPVNGTVSLVGGQITFTPDANYYSTASFDYTLSDGTDTDTGHVAVNVAAVNDVPVAGDDTISATEDTPLTFAASTLVGNDSDAENDALTVTAVGNAVSGTVSLVGGNITFTPNADFFGTASFDYTVSDGTDTDTGAVTVNVAAVNDAPVANDEVVFATEDTPVTLAAADLVGNDTDADDDTLTVTAVGNPVNGTVSLVGGQITFTPDANYYSTASFDYTLSDGTDTDTGHVAVNVAAVNDVPVAGDDTISATEDTPLTFAASTLVGNDSDAENDALTVTAVGNAVNGTVGLVAGQITFTPDANFNGTASFDYTVSDGNDTDSGAVTVNVAAVNDAPVANDDTLSATEDTPVTYTAADLVGNDTDVELDTLVIDSVAYGTGGTPVLNLDGTVTFTPASDMYGSVFFNYVVSDGNGGTDSGIATVNVAAVNDAPTVANAIADQPPTQINNAFTFTFAANTFADVEGDSLTYTATLADDSALPAWLTFTAATRSFSGTPLVGDIATIDVKVTANDGNGGTNSDVFSISVVTDNDTLTGGAGDDVLSGGTGDDSLSGGLGNDNLQGNSGVDTLIGNAGNDTLDGGAEADLIYGSADHDSMLGGAGIDTLVGNAGNDTINGGTEDDQVFGSVGDDYVLGGLGADVVQGNAGNDTVVGGDGTGTDTLDGNDSLDGGAGNDSLSGGFGADNVLGGAGFDTLIGNAGNDTMDGGLDGDLAYGSAGDDSILGGAGIDTLVGNAGNDTLNGGTEDDQVFGSAGDDYVLGGLGADVVQGNAGNDTVIGGDGTGTDTLDGNDSLDGGAGNDSLSGGFGNDNVLAGAGFDTVIGNAGNDTLDGGADGDLAYGSAGDDSVLGGAGADTLVGNAGNDVLNGGTENDQIFGSTGDDVLIGGAGNDTMQGNAGTDTFRYDALSLNTGDVAAGQADFVSATAAGDLISMLGLNDELTINGTALSALTANALVGNALNASNNIAFTGGVLQIDLDGNDVFNALNDFQVQLTGVTTVTYNATSDLFQLS